MAFTETEFQRYENLRARYLEEAKLAGFTGQDLVDVQLATSNFLHDLVRTKTQSTSIVAPAITPTVVDTNAQQF
jgi:hypothetical protein